MVQYSWLLQSTVQTYFLFRLKMSWLVFLQFKPNQQLFKLLIMMVKPNLISRSSIFRERWRTWQGKWRDLGVNCSKVCFANCYNNSLASILFAEAQNIIFWLWTVQAKLAAVESAHGDGQAKLNQQVQKLREEVVSLQDGKEKLTKKIEGLGSQLKQG